MLTPTETIKYTDISLKQTAYLSVPVNSISASQALPIIEKKNSKFNAFLFIYILPFNTFFKIYIFCSCSYYLLHLCLAFPHLKMPNRWAKTLYGLLDAPAFYFQNILFRSRKQILEKPNPKNKFLGFGLEKSNRLVLP